MKVRYLGTYTGNVEGEAGWLPGEVRDVDDELGARLAEAPLWEATDDAVGIPETDEQRDARLAPPAAEEPEQQSETAIPDTAAADTQVTTTAQPSATDQSGQSDVPPATEAPTGADDGNDDEGAGARRRSRG